MEEEEKKGRWVGRNKSRVRRGRGRRKENRKRKDFNSLQQAILKLKVALCCNLPPD